ncbi:MAG: hypothetical protein NTW37_20605 [Proteobacteria bacterium]|nr:hypothetical protein [Pseudomonadota bacterium]
MRSVSKAIQHRPQFLVRGDARSRARALEQQQPLQGGAGQHPAQREQQQVVGDGHATDAGERRHQPAGIAHLSRFAGEVAARIAGDHPADERHQQRHHGARDVGAQQVQRS